MGKVSIISSVSSQVAQVVTGTDTDTVMLYLYFDAVSFVIGMYLCVKSKNLDIAILGSFF